MEKSKIPVRKVGGCVMDPDTFYLDPDPENCPNLDPDPGPNLDPEYYHFEKRNYKFEFTICNFNEFLKRFNCTIFLIELGSSLNSLRPWTKTLALALTVLQKGTRKLLRFLVGYLCTSTPVRITILHLRILFLILYMRIIVSKSIICNNDRTLVSYKAIVGYNNGNLRMILIHFF